MPEFKIALVPVPGSAFDPTGSWKPYEAEAVKQGDVITIEAETREDPNAPTTLDVRVTVVDDDTMTLTVQPVGD